MPVSNDPRIDAYIARSAPFAQPILRRLRTLIHQACPEIEETFKWSHPNFVYREKILCNFAAFKAHATFGFWHQEMQKILAHEIGKTTDAMGLFGRLTRLEDLPPDATLRRYIKAGMKLSDSGGPTRPKREKRPPLVPPADLSAALKNNPAAAATFAGFPPGQRREYIDWIIEAKREETRGKRLATAIAWLAEGKPRNWKYESC